MACSFDAVQQPWSLPMLLWGRSETKYKNPADAVSTASAGFFCFPQRHSGNQPYICLNRSTFQLKAGILIVAFSFSTTPPGPSQGATFIGFFSVLVAFTSS